MTGSPFIVTASGLRVSLLNPHPQVISIRDIAHHLALTNRFCGATLFPYSVAQHSVLVADLLVKAGAAPRLALLGLLHDAHEAYLHDLTTPAKQALFGPEHVTPYDFRCRVFDEAIRASLELAEPSAAEIEAVAAMDLIAFATEWRDLMPDEIPCPSNARADRARVKPLAWDNAEDKFFSAYERLALAAGLA
jgi:5'-deoxynucleotidase YfbR-like HD superfamily hydrolase